VSILGFLNIKKKQKKRRTEDDDEMEAHFMGLQILIS